jgi:hypothetical protein
MVGVIGDLHCLWGVICFNLNVAGNSCGAIMERAKIAEEAK